jgi:hypothetical protein
MFVCCECRVFSGRGLCDKMITRPEESYWLWRLRWSGGQACWPLVPEFAGSNPAEVVGFFQYVKKSSACLPSEGKWKNLSHVPALRHVKEPSTSVNPSRGLSCLCGAWRLWRWMRELFGGKGTISLLDCSAEYAPLTYWLWCVVLCDLETARMRRPWPALGRRATKKQKSLRNKVGKRHALNVSKCRRNT